MKPSPGAPAARPRHSIHVSAALDNQAAVELKPRTPREQLPDVDRFGALTWFLTAAMIRAKAGDTHRKVTEEAVAAPALTTYDQQVEAEEGTLTVLIVTSVKPQYVTVLSLSEARQAGADGMVNIDVVLPTEDAPGDSLVEGQRRIPIHVAATDGWKMDRPVRERYLVITTKRHVNFGPLVGADSWGVIAVDLLVQRKKP